MVTQKYNLALERIHLDKWSYIACDITLDFSSRYSVILAAKKDKFFMTIIILLWHEVHWSTQAGMPYLQQPFHC